METIILWRDLKGESNLFTEASDIWNWLSIFFTKDSDWLSHIKNSFFNQSKQAKYAPGFEPYVLMKTTEMPPYGELLLDRMDDKVVFTEALNKRGSVHFTSYPNHNACML